MGGSVITGYVEFTTRAAMESMERAIGQAFAVSRTRPWPMPPTTVGPGRFPCNLRRATAYANLTPTQQARVPKQAAFKSAIRYDDGTAGGVLVVTDAIDALAVPMTKVARTALSARARALLTSRPSSEV